MPSWPSGADVEVVGVNDLTSAATLAHLLRYDSTQGRLPVPVDVEGGDLWWGSSTSAVVAEREPVQLPWGRLGAEVVIESTGLFTARADAAGHLDGTVKRVIISAPSGDADATFVIGVNDDEFDPEQHIVVSNASCTTNCFVPMVKVLDDAFGIVSGLMTTVHAYTNDQNLLDLTHTDLRRARAGAVNIVPSLDRCRPGHAAWCCRHEGPARRHRRCGCRCRPAPSPTSPPWSRATPRWPRSTPPSPRRRPSRRSTVCSSTPRTRSSPATSWAAPPRARSTPGSPWSSRSTTRLSLVKVEGWYDNEWGYSNRLVDLTVLVGG